MKASLEAKRTEALAELRLRSWRQHDPPALEPRSPALEPCLLVRRELLQPAAVRAAALLLAVALAVHLDFGGDEVVRSDAVGWRVGEIRLESRL